jgi:hypothetical protein
VRLVGCISLEISQECQPEFAAVDVIAVEQRVSGDELLHLPSPLQPCLAYSTHLLLRRFTFMSMCGMNTGNRCPYPPFPFPPITPIRAPALDEPPNRTFVGPLAQPLSNQTSRLLTPLHTLSPTHSM